MDNRPDILVSVDLGTTFTGVAWMTPCTPIQVINDWPGSGDRGERKVPTALVYNADGSLLSWGFICADDDTTVPGRIRREFFKIFLDEDILTAAQQQGLSNTPRDTAEAQRLLTDYLQQIYAHVKETIEMQIGIRHTGGWRDVAVSFLFSVPTTWTNIAIINTFKGIVRDAGFGIEGPRHTAHVDLTEAEAAAVATLKTSAIKFNVGSMFLTVDAGGGTTDLALMRVTSNHTAFPQMSQVSAVRGIGTGSSLIDRAFARLVAQRLAAYPDAQERLPAEFAARIARNHHFKTVKHKFGEKVYMQKVFKIQLEGVSYDFSHLGIRVEEGRMLFSQEEIQSLFDMQIEGIMKRIKEQLDWMSENGISEQVEYMILAGGLGSSAYVRDTIRQQLSDYNHPNARQIIIIPCQDPQLVVVRGLLFNQQQKMETGDMAVLATRIARASYGVVVREPYQPAIHFDEDVRHDVFIPNQKWAINQIQWLIRKGDVINPNSSLAKTFEIKLGPRDTTRSWDAEIVVSHNEPSFLPRSLKQAGATKLCSVKSNLTGVQQSQLILKKKRGCCVWRGYLFYVCRFDVRVIVAPADLRFELWFDGCRFSGNHEPIAVKWD
ncbi:hypothetical protein B0J13DRAFT_514682 [Dactylonectria estremocensis]|uniref:Hsp70 family chaperone n=1 Tax=Dactylonectria estremocensis TaxID=1079267 RepID=A0A9P9IDI3_9HYPO|nr:hypothetical protein B0J13DRAFT_514682 [Dactylonectria estremocensis]